MPSVIVYRLPPGTPDDCHFLMVALDSMEPRLLQPFKHQVRFGASVDKVSNGEQTISGWIKFNDP
jgi:hypothetical protein